MQSYAHRPPSAWGWEIVECDNPIMADEIPKAPKWMAHARRLRRLDR